MTAQNRATNKARFEQGDQPQGTDYSDLIDSYLSLPDTTAQTIQSDVTFAGSIVIGGSAAADTMQASTMSAASMTINSLNLTGFVTAMATASAVTGAGQTIPNRVDGYLVVTVCGKTVALPFFTVA